MRYLPALVWIALLIVAMRVLGFPLWVGYTVAMCFGVMAGLTYRTLGER